MESETLYDCHITYHLVNGQNVTEIFAQDIPKEVWGNIRDQFSDELFDSFEIDHEHFAKILIPKNSVLYISMKVSNAREY